jgi:hypothetical protein
MMATRLSLVALLVTLAGGCAITQNLEKDERFNGTAADAVLIFTAPSTATIWLRPGTDDGVNWSCDVLRSGYRVYPDGGFVVVKVKPRTGNERYAIAELATGPNGADPKSALEGASIPTFNAPPGKVTLVGGITAVDQGDDVRLDQDESATRERAERYLARSYPNLIEPVMGKTDWLYVKGSCHILFDPPHGIM